MNSSDMLFRYIHTAVDGELLERIECEGYTLISKVKDYPAHCRAVYVLILVEDTLKSEEAIKSLFEKYGYKVSLSRNPTKLSVFIGGLKVEIHLVLPTTKSVDRIRMNNYNIVASTLPEPIPEYDSILLCRCRHG